MKFDFPSTEDKFFDVHSKQSSEFPSDVPLLGGALYFNQISLGN